MGIGSFEGKLIGMGYARKTWLAVAIVAASGASCAPGTGTPVATTPGAGGDPCAPADPSLRELVRQTDFLVLGEIHGSTQVPRFTLQTTCAALARSRPVVLGLEVFEGEQERIDRFLQSPGKVSDRRELLAGPFWRRESQDGRASDAMYELLDGVRRLIGRGAELGVYCFDGETLQGDRNRDHAMAQRLIARHRRDPDAIWILLTGNIHARTRVGVPWNPQLRPMGWYLEASGIELVSLNVRHSPGEFWVCIPECGVAKLGGKGSPDASGVVRYPQRDADGYDGVFDVGVPSASLPAARQEAGRPPG